jgi:hypothetical protein
MPSESSGCMDVLDDLASGIVRYRHKLGECRSSEECVIRRLKVCYLKLQVFCMDVFPSPKGDRESNLADGGHCCTMDYSVSSCYYKKNMSDGSVFRLATVTKRYSSVVLDSLE